MSAPCGREGDWLMGCGPGKKASPGPPAQPAARLSSLPTSRLAARALPSRPGKPSPESASRGKRLTTRGLGCGERVQSKLCQRRPERSSQGPAGPGGGAWCPGGSLQPASRLPVASPCSRSPPPGADRLPAGSGQPGSPHTGTCAPPSAPPALKSAPPSRAPPSSLAHDSPDAPGIGAGARDAGALFPAALYLVARPGLWGPGADPTGQDPPLPRPLPRPRQVGAVESPPHPSWLLSPALLYSLDPQNELHAGSCRGRQRTDTV